MSTKRRKLRSSKSRKKRKTLTLKLKHDILRHYEEGMKVCEIARKLNLKYPTVGSIVKDKKRILEGVKSEQSNATMIRKKHGIIAEMENLLKEWCLKNNTNQLDNGIIRDKAKEIFEKLKKKENNKDSFVASQGWYRRFKLRCDWENMAESKDKVNKLQEIIKGYNPQTVFSMTETGLLWKNFPIEGKIDKDRVVLLLAGNATGDCRLKPLLAYHCENPKALKHKSKSGLPVIWKFNPEAIVTTSVWKDWFSHHFIPEVERFCKSQNLQFNVMLILDEEMENSLSTLTHIDQRVKVVFFPFNPTDSVIPVKAFRANYTRRFFTFLMEAITQKEHTNIQEFWESFNLLNCIRIIGESWAEIPVEILKADWTKLCPFFVELYTNSEAEYVEQVIGDVITITKHMNLEVDRGELYKLLDLHDEEDLDDLLMEKETKEESFQTEKVEKLKESLKLIESGVRILEEIDSDEERVTTAKQSIQQSIACYVEILHGKTSPQ